MRRLILQTGISIDGYVAGLPLFGELAAPLHLELVDATTYSTGVAVHVYRPR